jgi:hypothetical protein
MTVERGMRLMGGIVVLLSLALAHFVSFYWPWLTALVGWVAILDWRTDVEPIAGPPLAHRIAPAVAVDEMRFAGFEEIVSVEVGKYSWIVQGEKTQ